MRPERPRTDRRVNGRPGGLSDPRRIRRKGNDGECRHVMPSLAAGLLRYRRIVRRDAFGKRGAGTHSHLMHLGYTPSRHVWHDREMSGCGGKNANRRGMGRLSCCLSALPVAIWSARIPGDGVSSGRKFCLAGRAGVPDINQRQSQVSTSRSTSHGVGRRSSSTISGTGAAGASRAARKSAKPHSYRLQVYRQFFSCAERCFPYEVGA